MALSGPFLSAVPDAHDENVVTIDPVSQDECTPTEGRQDLAVLRLIRDAMASFRGHFQGHRQ
jgi:hypothetical protein